VKWKLGGLPRPPSETSSLKTFKKEEKKKGERETARG